MGRQAQRTLVLKREAHKDKNQEAKRNLIPPQQLKTAAKRRREPEGEAPQWGLGQSPKRGMGVAALTFLIIKKAVSEQNAKHSAIETGRIALQTIEQP